MNRSHGRFAARLALAGAAAGFLCLASTGIATAAAVPDPLGSLVTAPSAGSDPLGGARTGLTDAAAGTVGQLLQPGGTTQPQLAGRLPAGVPKGLPSGLPGGLPAPPAIPALPGQSPGGAHSGTGKKSAGASPAEDDTIVTADAAVRDLLGACVQLTRSGVPVRTTVVVLDRNLIDQLSAVGLPLNRLLVPCPKDGAAVTTPEPSTSGAEPAGSHPARGTASVSVLPSSLAFTGTDIAPTVLLAVGLLALGLAFVRKARLLGELAPSTAVRG